MNPRVSCSAATLFHGLRESELGSAAIHGQLGPGGEGCLEGEEHHRFGDLGRCAHPLHRVVRGHLCLRLLGPLWGQRLLQDARIDRSRADRIDTDPTGGATHGRGPVPWSELPPRVQRLEGVLGVRLLERTPQGSHLTAAGAAFLPQAQAVLTSTRQAVIAARGAAAPHVITVGYTEDLSRRYRSPPRVLV